MKYIWYPTLWIIIILVSAIAIFTYGIFDLIWSCNTKAFNISKHLKTLTKIKYFETPFECGYADGNEY